MLGVVFFCKKGQDSILHLLSECVIISNARYLFFRSINADIAAFDRNMHGDLIENPIRPLTLPVSTDPIPLA